MARYVDHVPPSPAAAQPRALIVTVYGLYARGELGQIDRGAPAARPAPSSSAGPAATAGCRFPCWYGCSPQLDVDEPAVRSAISRLKRRGLLRPVAAGRRGRLRAVRCGRRDPGRGRRAHLRADRAAARRRLAARGVLGAGVGAGEAARRCVRSSAALGFGACASGVWVAPAHRLELTAASLERHGLAAYVDLFARRRTSRSATSSSTRRRGGTSTASATAYQEFIAAQRRRDRREPGDPGAAFAAWVRVLTAWRRLPYLRSRSAGRAAAGRLAGAGGAGAVRRRCAREPRCAARGARAMSSARRDVRRARDY